MRKRMAAAALLAALAGAGAGAGAWAATGMRQSIEVEYRQIRIQVDGEAIGLDAEPFIHIGEGRVFIPARPLAEALGARVEWDESTGTVHVYTKQYVTSRIEGDRRIWSMPGAGFELRAPLGWIRQEADPPTLLQLALPDPSVLNATVGVTRLPQTATPLPGEFDQLVESLGAIYHGFTIADRVETGNLVSATATATLAGRPVGLRMRLIGAEGGSWLLFALYPEGSRAALEPTIQGIFDSFRAH